LRAVWDLVVLVEGATAPSAVKRAILLVIFGTKFIFPSQGLQSSHFLILSCGEKLKSLKRKQSSDEFPELPGVCDRVS